MDKEDKKIKSIVNEYKMSMGGCFFTKNPEELIDNRTKSQNMSMDVEKECSAGELINNELELSLIQDTVKNYLFDTHELLSVYERLSEDNKRELFKKVVTAFIKLKSD